MSDGYDIASSYSRSQPDTQTRALLAEMAASSGRATVTAATPAAIGAGLLVFAKGGNAYDAALAAAFMENVAIPMKCGLGGDVIAMVSSGGKPEALVSIGPGIAALSNDVIPEPVGGNAIGIPGAPAGYAALSARGRLGLKAQLEPAIAAAEAGLRWTPIAVTLTQEAEKLLRQYNGATAFLPEGRLPQVGEVFRLPGLAKILRQFGELGAELFFGALGEALAARIQRAGGAMTAEDLRVNPCHWQAPVKLVHSRGTVWATPSPTHGPALLRSLELLDAPGGDMVSAARQARAELKQQGAMATDSGTSVVTAADAEGNTVVIVHSNSFPTYGAGVLVEEWDLVLNNRPGRGFSKNVGPDACNAPKAGRVPFTTLNAWAAQTDTGFYTGATPGGINQAVWNMQNISDCLAGKMPGDVVTAPRFALNAEDGVVQEADWPGVAPDAKIIAPLSQRSATQIILRRRGDDAVVFAAADPRIGGRSGAL